MAMAASCIRVAAVVVLVVLVVAAGLHASTGYRSSKSRVRTPRNSSWLASAAAPSQLPPPTPSVQPLPSSPPPPLAEPSVPSPPPERKELWTLEELNATDPLDAEVIAIGRELGRYFETTTPGKTGWYYSRVAGVLLVARGGGVIDSVRFHPGCHAWQRYAFPATYAVRDALSAGNRAGTVKTGTIVHFGLEDHDIYFHQAHEDEASPIAQSVLDLTRAYPNLFFAHWNPSVVNRTRGSIGVRMVPIPDFEALGKLDVAQIKTLVAERAATRRDGSAPAAKGERAALAVDAKPWRERTATVAWRGSTTGQPDQYQNSDRYRVVDAFLRHDNGAAAGTVILPPGVTTNVRFSDVSQGVTESFLPPGAVGGPMAAADVLNARVLLDIDGNANAWSGFRWKLQAGAAVVKVDARRYIQWYYPLLRHGRDVWVVPVPEAGEGAAARVVRDSVNLALGDAGPLDPAGEVLSKNAETFARTHLTPPAALAAIYDILGDLEPYRDETRSWTVQIHPADE